MLTYLISTILPIAWKATLMSGAILLIAFIIMAISGGLAVASESLFGIILGLIFTVIPLIVVRLSAFVFSISISISAILFVLKMIL